MNVLTAPLVAAKLAVKTKFRLYLEYFLIILLVVTAAIGFWNYHKNKVLSANMTTANLKLAQAERDYNTVSHALNEQREALEKVEQLRKVDSVVLSSLQDDFKRIGARDTALSQSIALLEKNSAEVKSYLATATPTALACVLDRTCEAVRAASGDQTATGVPAAKPAQEVRRPATGRK